jgi:hypothetical protein
MTKDSKVHVIAYKNINERFRNLAKMGMIEPIEVIGITLHGRKDYRISKDAKFVLHQRIKRLQKIVK